MINVTTLRNGTVFKYHGDPYKVINYDHVKTARGGATIKLKVQNIISGVIKIIGLSNNEKVEEADVENKNLQYLYSDESLLYFMDLISYEQIEIPLKLAQNESKYLVEGKEFRVVFYSGDPISVIIPPGISYKVKEAPPAVRGNTATSATKKITLENGLITNAPQFIKVGDTVKINTTTGEYVGRTS